MKKKIFNILGITLVNVLIFVIIELLLRAFNVGYKPDLFYETNIDNEAYLYFNDIYTYRYFTNANYTVPAPNPHLFKKQKDENTFRIYVIGESTSRGFPYSRTESFPFQLEQVLNAVKPGKQIEVINFSMDATNSNIGKDIVDEAIQYPPDLAIIYYGHNEFIGIGGMGEHKHWYFRLNEKLAGVRLYQLVKSVVSKFSQRSEQQLLERMATKKPVEYGDELFTQTLYDFSENYTYMLDKFTQAGVKTIACGVACNLKDFKPSEFNVDKAFVQQLDEAYESAGKDFLESFDSLCMQRADLNYMAGKYLLLKHKNELAKNYFINACNYDGLRLRAPSAINDSIHANSKKFSAIYVDFQEVISSHNTDSIAGNTEILEHVHPNNKVQTLMAVSLAKLIAKHEFNIEDSLIQSPKINKSIVEDVASEEILKSLFIKYPLKDLNYFNPYAFGKVYVATGNSIESLKLKKGINAQQFATIEPLFDKYKDIDKIHLKYGTILHQQKQLNMAYQEFFLAYQQNPKNFLALNNMAIIRFTTGDKKNGLRMQQRVTAMEEEYITGLSNLWLMLKDVGKHKQAKEVAEKLKKLKSDTKNIRTFVMEEL